jgi:hypothetical protein
MSVVAGKMSEAIDESQDVKVDQHITDHGGENASVLIDESENNIRNEDDEESSSDDGDPTSSGFRRWKAFVRIRCVGHLMLPFIVVGG